MGDAVTAALSRKPLAISLTTKMSHPSTTSTACAAASLACAPTQPRVVSDAAPSRSARVVVVKNMAQLRTYSAAWDALNLASESPSIFLSWAWIEEWLATVGAGRSILTVVVQGDDGELLGAAPFYLTRMKLARTVTFNCLRVLGDADSGAEYPDVLVRKGLEPVVLPLLRDALIAADGWNLVWLPNMAGWTGAARRFDALFPANLCHAHRRPCEFAARDLPATADEFMRGLSGNMRSTVKRQNAKLEAAHRVTFEQCRGGDDLPRFLAALYDLHQKRWASEGRDGAFLRCPVMQGFYDRFSVRALEMNALRMFALTIDGEIRAVQYGYAYGGAFYQLQEGFDPAADSGAGNALRTRVFDACIQEGLTHYDFLGEFTEHKRRWGAAARAGEDRLIGRKTLKNAVLFKRPVWPTGRYLRECPA